MRQSKYNATPTVLDGIRFDSKGEAARYAELRLLEKTGQISGLRRQVPFSLEANGQRICRYIADFQYTEDGVTVTEDFKGCVTPEFKLKARLMEVLLGITVRITKGKG